MLRGGKYVQLTTIDDLPKQRGHDREIGECRRPAFERIDDPLDTAIHFTKSKMTNPCSQGWAAWT
jgi:hypothetical protein